MYLCVFILGSGVNILAQVMKLFPDNFRNFSVFPYKTSIRTLSIETFVNDGLNGRKFSPVTVGHISVISQPNLLKFGIQFVIAEEIHNTLRISLRSNEEPASYAIEKIPISLLPKKSTVFLLGRGEYIYLR